MEQNTKPKSPKDFGIEQGTIDIDKCLSVPPATCECGGKYLYQGLGTYICEGCQKVFKNEYAIVRDFVDKYGTSYSIMEIASMTGVPKKLIDMFIRDGRFKRAEKQKVCIVCKQPILSGTYCDRCALKQISDSMELDREKKKYMGTIRTGDMRGSMHIGMEREKRDGNDRKK